MSISATELQSMLDKLRRARATGVLSVKHGETLVQYKSDADMQAAENSLEKQLAAANGTRRSRVAKAFQASKGL